MSDQVPFTIVKIVLGSAPMSHSGYYYEDVLDIVEAAQIIDWQFATKEDIELYKRYISSRQNPNYNNNPKTTYALVTRYEIEERVKAKKKQAYGEIDFSKGSIEQFRQEEIRKREEELKQQAAKEEHKRQRAKTAAIKKLKALFPNATDQELKDMYDKMGNQS